MFNFEDVGGKLKGLAKFFFGFSVVIAIIGGSVMLIFGVIDELPELVLLAPLASFVYCLLAWCAALPLYGIGQAVENSEQLLENSPSTPKNTTDSKESYDMAATKAQMAAAAYIEKKCNSVSENYWICNKCGARNPKTSRCCQDCREYR